MPWNDKRANDPTNAEEIVYDDGGTGLFDACVERFGCYGWDIKCDAQHAVWIRDPRTYYSVGLSRWVLERQSLDKVLADAEARINRVGAEATV